MHMLYHLPFSLLSTPEFAVHMFECCNIGVELYSPMEGMSCDTHKTDADRILG